DVALKPETIEPIYKLVEKKIEAQLNYVPKELEGKIRDLKSSETKIHRFIQYIADGRESSAVSQALEEEESRKAMLEMEIKDLRVVEGEKFQAPSKEWIASRIADLKSLLEKNIEQSAKMVKEITGIVTLIPEETPDGKKHYKAKTKLKTLSLLTTAD